MLARLCLAKEQKAFTIACVVYSKKKDCLWLVMYEVQRSIVTFVTYGHSFISIIFVPGGSSHEKLKDKF